MIVLSQAPFVLVIMLPMIIIMVLFFTVSKLLAHVGLVSCTPL
jgi:hypothetical protein